MRRNLVLLVVVSVFTFFANNLMADQFGPFGPIINHEPPVRSPLPRLPERNLIPLPDTGKQKEDLNKERFFDQFLPLSRKAKINKFKIADDGGIICNNEGCNSSSGGFRLETLVKDTDGSKYQFYKGEGLAIVIEPLEGYEVDNVDCEDLRYITPDDADLHAYNFNQNVRFRGKDHYVACVLMPAPEEIDNEYLDRDGNDGVRYNDINLKLNDGSPSPEDTSISDGTVVYKSNPCAQPLDFEAIFADVLDPYHPRPSEDHVDFCPDDNVLNCELSSFYNVYLMNELNSILRAQGMAPFEWEFESEIWGKEFRSPSDMDLTYQKKDISRTNDAYEWHSARLEREDFEDAELEVPPESEIRNDLKYVKTVGMFRNYERMPVSYLAENEDVREYAKITLHDSCPATTDRPSSVTKIIPFNVKYPLAEEELMLNLKTKMKVKDVSYVNGPDARALLDFHNSDNEPIAVTEKFNLGACKDDIDAPECDGSEAKTTLGPVNFFDFGIYSMFYGYERNHTVCSNGVCDNNYAGEYPFGSITDIDQVWLWVGERDNGSWDELLEMKADWITLYTKFYSASLSNDVKVDTPSTAGWGMWNDEVFPAVIFINRDKHENDDVIGNEYRWNLSWRRLPNPDWN